VPNGGGESIDQSNKKRQVGSNFVKRSEAEIEHNTYNDCLPSKMGYNWTPRNFWQDKNCELFNDAGQLNRDQTRWPGDRNSTHSKNNLTLNTKRPDGVLKGSERFGGLIFDKGKTHLNLPPTLDHIATSGNRLSHDCNTWTGMGPGAVCRSCDPNDWPEVKAEEGWNGLAGACCQPTWISANMCDNLFGISASRQFFNVDGKGGAPIITSTDEWCRHETIQDEYSWNLTCSPPDDFTWGACELKDVDVISASCTAACDTIPWTVDPDRFTKGPVGEINSQKLCPDRSPYQCKKGDGECMHDPP
jgi:hypothetical protein